MASSVDVTKMAKEAGIKWPVALTAAVYGKYVEVPDGVTGQDETGRLWDILWMLRRAAGRCQGTPFTFNSTSETTTKIDWTAETW